MKTSHILCIANSFGQDSTTYISALAENCGMKLDAINLHIAGCSLEMHYRNMLSESRDYLIHLNGCSTGFKTSIKEALSIREWDYVMLHQASRDSFKYETFQPYLHALAGYVRTYQPKTKLLIQQTWGFESGSVKLRDIGNWERQEEMLAPIRDAYEQAAKDVHADLLIPSGEVMCALESKGLKVHRDTYHASYGIGRLAIALTWIKMLTDLDATPDKVCKLAEPLDADVIRTIYETVDEIVAKHKS